MGYRPNKDTEEKIKQSQSLRGLSLAEVLSVPDDEGHRIVIREASNLGEGEEIAGSEAVTVAVSNPGDIALPAEGDIVVVAELMSGSRVVLGSIYSDPSEIRSYSAAQRTLGHGPTDAEVTIEEDGSITISAAPGKPVKVGDIDVSTSTDNPLSVPHTEWSDALSDEEIWRVELQADERLRVYRLEVAQKGGGSSGMEIDLYDVDNSTVIASTSGVEEGNPVAESGVGSTVIARITNTTTSRQIASLSSKIAIIKE